MESVPEGSDCFVHEEPPLVVAKIALFDDVLVTSTSPTTMHRFADPQAIPVTSSRAAGRLFVVQLLPPFAVASTTWAVSDELDPAASQADCEEQLIVPSSGDPGAVTRCQLDPLVV